MGRYAKSMAKLRNLLDEISRINSAIAALSWDMEVYMPQAANDAIFQVMKARLLMRFQTSLESETTMNASLEMLGAIMIKPRNVLSKH